MNTAATEPTEPRPRPPADADARAQALDPTASFLVQAPAGSGKTELLTDRILALLATVERPEDILAITFTRKAAAEMHERVLAKLAAARAASPPADPQGRRSWALAQRVLARDAARGWNLLAHPVRLGVRTIDAFCATLARRMPWLSELGGMPAVAEDARAHYRGAAQATLAMTDAACVRSLLAHLDVDLSAAREALAQMLAARDQWLPLLAHGTERAALQQNLHAAVHAQLQRLAAAMPPGWAQALAGPVRLAAETLHTQALEQAARNKLANKPAIKPANKPAISPLAALLDWDGAITATPADLPRWRALAHLLLTAQGTLRSPKGIRIELGFAPKTAHKAEFVDWLAAQDGQADWCARLAALTTLPACTALSDAQWEILSAQLACLKLAAAQLTVQFARAGEVDFIDIAQRAARALGEADAPGELLLALDARIEHILIDEFQDTSQTQLALLRALTAGWQAGDGRTLFLVGDPMQSIYRFRKAEVGLFLHVRDHGLSAPADAPPSGLGSLRPEFLQLRENFRSQAGIVEWVNRVFAARFPAHDDPTLGAIRYAPSTAYHPAHAGEAVSVHTVWAGTQADQQTETLALELARAAQAAGQTVAILVRARNHIGALAQRLAQARVAYRAVELVPLAQRPVVIDCVQLARALAHPGDRMAWLSVLRAPWCGARLATLTQLFGEDHRTPVPVLLARALQPGGAAASLPADERARLARVAAVLLAEPEASLPFAAQLQAIWQQLDGPRMHAGPGEAEDLQSLLHVIERIAPYGALDGAQLEAELRRLYASAGGASDTTDTDMAPPVELMTMHKSKGLQFDTVILLGLHRLPRAGEVPLVRFEHSAGQVLMGPIKARADLEADPLSAYLAAREQTREQFETDRLLYVATTRARARLHLIGVVAPDKKTGGPRAPAASSLLGRLWPYIPEPVPLAGIEAQATQADSPQRAGGPLRRLRFVAEPAADASARSAPGTAAHAAQPGAPFQIAHAERYADLTGTVAHAWLARIGTDGLAAWPPERLAERLAELLPRIRRQLSRAGVPEPAQADCALEVLATLEATLTHPRGRWLLGLAHARREWPLLDAAGKVSVIDLAVSEDNGWLVVDYKTSRPQPDESAAHFAARMRARYQAQLTRYCQQLHALDGRAAHAALYFPRADLWLEMDEATASGILPGLLSGP